MKTYQIVSGSFVLADGSTKQAGDQIDLADDIALQHKDKLAPVDGTTALAASDGDETDHGDHS